MFDWQNVLQSGRTIGDPRFSFPSNLYVYRRMRFLSLVLLPFPLLLTVSVFRRAVRAATAAGVASEEKGARR